jgi:glyoxylase-like metal-dependent hydrolase (beta-lactamase superfamily II)
MTPVPAAAGKKPRNAVTDRLAAQLRSELLNKAPCRQVFAWIYLLHTKIIDSNAIHLPNDKQARKVRDMWIQKPGIINDRMVMLGTNRNTIYLLKGDVHMFVGGGGPWMIQELMGQIKAWNIDMQRVQYLFVGHSHFDHAGAVPFLQKRYPHLEILASQEAARFFAMPKAIQNARKFCQDALCRMGVPDTVEGISLDFDTIEPVHVLSDSERIDIGGGLVLCAFETPGHSRCSMTLYAEEQKWLFPSDTLSIPINEGWDFACTASESFVDYLRSLKRLEKLEVSLCAWEHFGLMTDQHVHQIVQRVLRSTLAYKDDLKKQVEASGDVEAVVDWATRQWLDQTGFEFIPLDVMRYICRQMVRNAIEEELADEYSN